MRLGRKHVPTIEVVRTRVNMVVAVGCAAAHVKTPCAEMRTAAVALQQVS